MGQNRARNVQLNIRVTEEEAARIRQRAAECGLNLSSYARRKLIGAKEAPQINALELRPLYVELKRCGNNANQIARSLNTYGVRAVSPATVAAVLGSLSRAAGAVSEALTALRE